MRHPTTAALSREDAVELGQSSSVAALMREAAAIRDQGKGATVSYSRKVFIPLTELCRDVCHYCTYAKTPRQLDQIFLSPDQVLEIARAGKAVGCREALFTLGDKPELRYRAAREALAALGHESTIGYLKHVAQRVFDETGLLPHLNPGVLGIEDYKNLRTVAPSMGIMLESTSPALLKRGGAHFGSPDKDPEVRLQSIRAAGSAKVPLTSGILIGIGETRFDRIDSLIALRELHIEFGHIQEIIVQNFVPKPGTVMHAVPEPAFEELLWTIAMARHIFGPDMNIQAPPNLNAGRLSELVDAGINDWGGVSPVTPDHVNPESPWPQLDKLATQTALAGKTLVQRLTLYPEFVRDAQHWVDDALVPQLYRHSDAGGFARCDSWSAGTRSRPPFGITPASVTLRDGRLTESLQQAKAGERLSEQQLEQLFHARGPDFETICNTADEVRADVCGDTVAYVVNRNINYTNVCGYKCQFCAFSKGKTSENLRGTPFVLDMEEIGRRSKEAWQRGATEVCLQGGIHPAYTGQTYLDICHAVKEAAPGIHIHAFSPLEVSHGAQSLGLDTKAFLTELKAAGLGSLPGTAAEILDDEIRQTLCADKVTTQEWLDIMRTAHTLGIPTTSTIMFGHMESPVHWARHLLALRDLQTETGGFTEFVPLPFVHMEAPLFRRGRARLGPTWRETLLMHAVARLALNPVIRNIQTSWVKLGAAGAGACLRAGANDLGGTLMNESISRAAGADHGQELTPEKMDRLIADCDRKPCHRSTLYTAPAQDTIAKSYRAKPLAPAHNRHARLWATR